MKSLVFTTLYPNPCVPSHGIFVRSRTAALSRKIQSRIVAPISYLHQHSSLKSIPESYSYDNISVDYPRYFTIPKIYKKFDGRFLYYSTRKCVRRVFSEHAPDFFDASYAYPDGYAAMLHAREAQRPYFITVRGSDLYLLAEDRKRRPLIQQALCSAAGVVAVSRDLADKAICLGVSSKKIVVIGNGVDQVRFLPEFDKCRPLRKKLGIPESAIVLLCVGRLVALKRFDLLIECLQILKKQNMNDLFIGIIVGDGPENNHLRNMAERCGVSDSLLFAGRIDPEELTDWYNLSDQLLLLSTHEGSPNVSLEALSCGTPVLATRVGNLPELINGNNGFLVESPSPSQIAIAVQRMGKTGPEKRTLVRASIRHLTWESVATQQYDFYKHHLEKI